MVKLLLISFLSLSCKKELSKYPPGEYAYVAFWTNYPYVSGVDVYVKRWEFTVYDEPFTQLIYRDSEPECGDTMFKVLKVGKGAYYSIHYRDEDALTDIDTAFMIPAYNEDACVFINLNN